MIVELLAAVLLGCLVVYALTGGADFGGGVWDLLARGPRAAAQRSLIEHAITPVWEANHVWLIVAVVLLFSGFPAAFAAIGVLLHAPLTLALLGIVLRGSAFVFRRYGPPGSNWGRAFAVASVITPIFLGAALGGLSGVSWLSPFPLAVGLLALAVFAFLAAVYLTHETADADLREDFRARALGAWCAALGLAIATAAVAPARFTTALFRSPWSPPLVLAVTAASIGALLALLTRRWAAARLLAIGQVALLVLGWGFAQRPWLVYPDHTLETAAAPPGTLELLLVLVGVGGAIVVPGTVWLLVTFKR